MCIKCGYIELSMNVEGLEPEVKRIAQLIYDGKLTSGQIDKAMVKKIAGQLMKGIFKGYGKTLDSKSLTEDERTFLTKLNNNVYVFSGFKNYQQLRETTLLLKDDNGKLKSFKDFLTDVKKVNETYNEVYLNSEYGTAVASSQAAATWQDYTTNDIEMLTYVTAGDDRVREEHAMLEGATYPIDHEFWDTYFPPNDWGCRCDTSPAVGSEAVPIAHSELPDLPDMFQQNVGKTGVTFPDTHPYFDVPKGVAKTIRSQINDILEEE
jgi:SPP1 gp7 family putative phage head morphogenesis protein